MSSIILLRHMQASMYADKMCCAMPAGMATGSTTTLAGLPLDTGVEAGAAVVQGTGETATTQVCLSL